jgi:AcrR family transcriptional regulator
MAKQTYSKEERRAQFLKTGIALARSGGIKAVTAQAVATECGCTAPLVFHVFGNREALRRAVIAKLPKKMAAKAEADLAEAAAAKKPRKRSVKNKAAGKRPVRPATSKRKVSRSTKAKAKPDTTVAQKYPTQPVPAINMVDGEPKASI